MLQAGGGAVWSGVERCGAVERRAAVGGAAGLAKERVHWLNTRPRPLAESGGKNDRQLAALSSAQMQR